MNPWCHLSDSVLEGLTKLFRLWNHMRLCLILACLVLTRSASAEPFPVPSGYELQILEPLGGKVAKPKGWFYKGGMTPVGFDWVISKEKTSEYETGLQIQGFVGVKKGTGKSPRDFGVDGLKEKETGGKVFARWPETQVGLFHRSGVELEETHLRDGHEVVYHVIYTALWNDAWGMTVFTIFGAPASEWESVKDISGVMSHIEMIDMSRFENTKEPNKAPVPPQK
jgi:hypothetical protein